jgi:ABC-2 type transport system permease protein
MLSLYFRLIGARIRAQMQYKVSFWIELLGFALVTGIEFITIAILLTRFKAIGGWTLDEVALLYGMTAVALSLAEMIARGFDAPFETMMTRGTFDGVLIRPLGAFFQILASEFQLRRLGRTLQGGALLIYACARLPIAWTPATMVVLPLAILSGALIYGGLIVAGATICFWTIRTPEVLNAFLFGGEELTSYPLSIYNRWLRSVFLFLVPLGLANYPAALLLLGRADPNGMRGWLAWLSPLAAVLFFGAALAFWRLGVSKYTSTGS